MPRLIDPPESLAARLRREGLVSARDIAAGLPSCRGDKPRTRDAVTRWIKKGTLEGVKLPDGYYSSWPAVERMMIVVAVPVDRPVSREEMARDARKAIAEMEARRARRRKRKQA